MLPVGLLVLDGCFSTEMERHNRAKDGARDASENLQLRQIYATYYIINISPG